MANQFDATVYIGRFQLPHEAHFSTMRQALTQSEKLIIVLGGSYAPRTIKNPFNYQERMELIDANLTPAERKRVYYAPARDYFYNDPVWAVSIQEKVNTIMGDHDAKIALTGCQKDSSSYYLEMFPQWKQTLTKYMAGFDATTLRNIYLDIHGLHGINDIKGITAETRGFLTSFRKLDAYNHLLDEMRYLIKEKEKWAGSPHPVTFTTVDAVVFRSMHVLVVVRGDNLGKGLYALPGGFIDQDHSIVDNSVRELYEETKIVYPKSEIKKTIVNEHVFDHPERSLRGRTTTHAFNFDLGEGELPRLKKGRDPEDVEDDASHALWMPMFEVSRNLDRFFEDHAHIIEYFMYRQKR
jgi:bifunctional NMN adenylyltransferase/nudix hydrolase